MSSKIAAHAIIGTTRMAIYLKIFISVIKKVKKGISVS